MEELKAKIEKKLAYMQNKRFLFAGLICDINGYSVTNDKVYISTSAKLFVFDHSEFLEKRQDFQELEKVDKPVQSEFKQVIVKKQNSLSVDFNPSFLASTLLNSIKKIDENPAYIKQAIAINSTVKTMMDVAKTELAYKKMNPINKKH